MLRFILDLTIVSLCCCWVVLCQDDYHTDWSEFNDEFDDDSDSNEDEFNPITDVINSLTELEKAKVSLNFLFL